MKRTLITLTALGIAMTGSAAAQSAQYADARTGHADSAEPELIRVGDAAVDGSRILAGVATGHFEVSQNGEVKSEYDMTEAVELVTEGGKTLLMLSSEVSMAGGQTASTVILLDPGTLAPASVRSANAWQGETELHMWGNRARGTRIDADGTKHEIDYELDQPAFHPGSSSLVIRSLPLRSGYEAQLPILSPSDGAVTLMTVTVTGTEEVKTAAGEWVNAYVVASTSAESDGGATMWISEEDRTLLRMRSAWGDQVAEGLSTFERAWD